MTKCVIHIVTDVTVLVPEASHRQLARITTACLTRNGVVPPDIVTKCVQYMQAPSVEGIRNL